MALRLFGTTTDVQRSKSIAPLAATSVAMVHIARKQIHLVTIANVANSLAKRAQQVNLMSVVPKDARKGNALIHGKVVLAVTLMIASQA